jgi:phenylalanyl-tRNA synthetase beta chain
MPRWRADIMHPVDLVEEIATGIGYEALGTAHSALSIEGVQLPHSTLSRRLRTSMQSQGIQEVLSLTLSSDQIQFQMMNWSPIGKVTKIANPITTEHTLLRQRVLPSLLQLLAANRHHELPQRVYEVGEVVRDHQNALALGWACAETASGFTAAKGLTQAILRDLGTTALQIAVTFEPVSEADHWNIGEYGKYGPWLQGRGAKVIIDNTVVGQFGEIDPSVGQRFGLKVPIHAGEFDIEALKSTIPDPVL